MAGAVSFFRFYEMAVETQDGNGLQDNKKKFETYCGL
jgi:hypothetical protein